MGVCPHRGEEGARFLFFYMGALRWDLRDARTCIENCFTLFAHLDRFRHGERNMEASSRGLLSCSRNMRRQVCGLAAVIQARIGRGQSAGGRDDVSRETFSIQGG